MTITSRIVDNERISILTAGGLVLGLAGVVTLINPLSAGAPDLLASGVALAGALCWGCGSVYAKRAPHPGQPLLASGMEMICAGVALGLIGAASGEFGRISGAPLVSASGLALGYLIVFGSLLGYSTYEWLLHHASSQLAGTYAFASPLVAVALGWWLLGEQISGHTLVAAAAIAAGVALIMLHPRKPEPVLDEPGDQPWKRPAAQGPAADRHQHGHPAGGRAGPASVRIAVRLMYLGAAASLIKVIVDLATESATRSAELAGLEIGVKKSGMSATASQLNPGITATLAMAVVLGLISVGLWILVARASRRGKDWARATGSVLFGLGTLALLIGPPDVGIRGPETAVARIFAGIIWLIGLAAVVFLWQKDSSGFFKAPRSP